jgi:AcrR family transcriptional regulator
MPRPRSDIAPRILAAARGRFLAEGVDGAALRAIAEDAGTSIGMIYYYFPTKDDLFLAVVEEVYLGLLADLEAAVHGARPVRARIAALYARLGALCEDEQAVVRLVVREALTSPARLERLIDRFRRGHVPLLVGLVRDGFAAGVFEPTLPPALVLVALGALGGVGQLMMRALSARFDVGRAPAAAALPPLLVDVLLEGVGPRASRPAPRGRAARPVRHRPPRKR